MINSGGRRRALGGLAVAVSFAVLLVLPCASVAAADGGAGTASGPPADSTLPAEAAGAAAIDALGAHLPDVAKAYGLSADELRSRLRADPHLRVDRRGALFYGDEPGDGSEYAGAAATVSPTVAAGLAPLEDTFRLHSLLGAKRVLYLDFDGHVLSGTAWNNSSNGAADIVCPPYDFEGGAAVFTDNEKTRIQQAWQRVAEDYAPFAVDVTTEYPGEDAITRSSSADEYYGMRVLISPISSYFGSYGGMAYVSVFDAVGDYYKPALVFPEKLANAEKYIAEACSHEAGHTLGLYHDGTTSGVEYYQGHGSGATGWGPIMGSGYYQNLTQWSRGEYAGANNTQDDLTVMLGKGLSYRTDDNGNTPAAATRLAAGSPVTASGLIERTGDVDVFAIASGAGTLTVDAIPTEGGPNLDVLLELRDAAGTLLAWANRTDLLTASLAASVDQGTYYIAVRGTGMGDPLARGYSDYGCLGWYSLTVLVPGSTGNQPPVAVASGAPTSGVAPLPVLFDASQSYDPEGSISSYGWDFGDGSTGQGLTSSHAYAAAGTYTSTLTVVDGAGMADTASVSVTVLAPNTPPAARLALTPTSGVAPLAVSFDGSASSDLDGTIASYGWTFGDGATGSGATTQHTYATLGTYTVTLTATDDRGAVGTATATVTVLQAPAIVMRVASVQVVVTANKGVQQAKATVRVVDAAGKPVGGATVYGQYGGAVTETASGVTDATGTATVLSKKYKAKGTVTFAVTNVVKTGYSYSASAPLPGAPEAPQTVASRSPGAIPRPLESPLWWR